MLLFLTGLIAAVLGLVIAPFLFIRKHLRNATEMKNNYLTKFLNKHSDKILGIYLLDMAKPIAFSTCNFKHRIFISVGILDLLTRKETEAVLLHELAHINNKSSLLKSSTFVLRLFSPLSSFSTFHNELSREEIKADKFAIKSQGTNRHLKTAKRKIDGFYLY